MHATTQPKRKSKGCKMLIPAPKMGNFLPIEAQIKLKAQSRRHDKSRTRNKGKQWTKEC